MKLSVHLGRLWHAALIMVSAFVVSTLFGCAQYPRAPTKFDLDSSVDRWQGRIAVVVESSPKQAFSAYFDLQGDSKNGQMELSTALGTTLARMRWSTQEALLQTGANTRVYPSLSELTFAALGADLPFETLLQWLRGVPASDAGWQSDLSEFESGKVNARRLLPEPRVDLKIILDR